MASPLPLPAGLKILLIVVKGNFAILAFPKIFYQQFQFPGLHITGYRLGFTTGWDNDGRWEFQPAMGQVQRKFIRTVLGIELVGPPIPGNGGMGLRIYFDGIELFLEILSYLLV